MKSYLDKLDKEEREYVLSMALIETNSTQVVEPEFSPLTHCALCGKMFSSIAVSVLNQVPIQFTLNHIYYWDEPVCDCQ